MRNNLMTGCSNWATMPIERWRKFGKNYTGWVESKELEFISDLTADMLVVNWLGNVYINKLLGQ